MPAKTSAHRDEQLLVEAAQKDPARFTELYEANFERVYAFVARRVRSRDDAEDVTAEVFRDALANIRKFEWQGMPFAAWLYRIASNAVADRWERAAREQGTHTPNELPDNSSAADPEQIERQAGLFRLVERLPADQRRVIEMRFAEGRGIREIAQMLGRSEGAVKQLQFRGLESLRANLGRGRSEKSPSGKKHG